MTRPCPVCGALERRSLFKQSFEPLAGVGFLSGYDVVTCSRCGLCFADEISSGCSKSSSRQHVSQFRVLR
jgi:hypothetical protein